MRGGGLRLFANGSGHLWGWHPTALDIITKLGRQLARNVGKLDEEVVAHLCGSDWGYFWFGTTWQCSVLGHPLSLQQQQSMKEMIVNLSKSFFPAIVSFTTILSQTAFK